MKEKYTARLTKQFRKEYKKMIRQGKDITKLDNTIHKLLLGEPLPESQHDHPLTSNWADHRECHIEPNWLLIYHIYESVLVLELTRTGSHNDLFG